MLNNLLNASLTLTIVLVVVAVLVLFMLLLVVLVRYKKCPSDKVIDRKSVV